MADVITNNPPSGGGGGSGMGTGLVVGIVVVILVILAFLVFGVSGRTGGPERIETGTQPAGEGALEQDFNVDVPKEVDVNVNKDGPMPEP